MTYYVDFDNQTNDTWTMVVYQSIPDSIGLDSVAWKKTIVPKSAESGVEWEIDYLVALANYKQKGEIGVYRASQKFNKIPLGSKWKVISKDNVQQLERDGDAAKPELIVINNESGNLADIGIGMSNNPAFYKRNVLSGSGGQFKVIPTYHVGLFNNLELGTVVSSNVVVGPMEVKFPSGQNKAVLTAKLDGEAIKLDLSYQNALVAKYEQVQKLSRSIGSEFSDVPVEQQPERGIDYTFTATLVFGTLALATWAYGSQALIAQVANVVIDKFSSWDQATRTFKIVGQSALACATAMQAIVQAIKDNAPPLLLEELKSSVDVSYIDLQCKF
jgi:rhizosphere induced protein